LYTRKKIVRSFAATLLINGAAPLIAFTILQNYISSLSSLVIATIIPLLDNILGFMKNR
jgi:hypothetical protein